ncbi:MAG: chlorite dismutase family protein, partial [Elusimicrobiota bacterium]
MSETLETQPAKAPSPAAGAAPTFVNFQVLRIDPRYHTLLSNEKVVAKQEFLSCFDTFQRQMKLATYGLTGLSASGDLLLWRASPDLGAFNQMTGRLRGAGLGKYLTPSRSFLGAADRGITRGSAASDALGAAAGGEPGTARFLFLQAAPSSSDASGRGLVDEVRRQCALIPAVRLQVIACAGL